MSAKESPLRDSRVECREGPVTWGLRSQELLSTQGGNGRLVYREEAEPVEPKAPDGAAEWVEV